MREGDEPVKRYSRKSLRLLGTVGEPINPEAWEWYWRVVGDGRCPVVDTWWQTETGGILISPFPGATEMKPGSATKPLPGDQAAARRCRSTMSSKAPASGNLCLAASWPGQMRTVWGDHGRFFETYFKTYPRPLFHRRRLPPRRGRLLLDHRPGRRRDQRFRPPHRHRRGRKLARLAPQGRRGRGRRLSRTRSRARRSTPSSP